MATYLILNIVVLGLIILVLKRYGLRWSSSMTWLLIILLVTTAIFDSLIIAADIVAYDGDRILGVYIWKAPIEDFFYAVAVLLIVPTVWRKIGEKHDGKNQVTV